MTSQWPLGAEAKRRCRVWLQIVKAEGHRQGFWVRVPTDIPTKPPQVSQLKSVGMGSTSDRNEPPATVQHHVNSSVCKNSNANKTWIKIHFHVVQHSCICEIQFQQQHDLNPH